MMKQGEREGIVRYSKSKQMIFLRAKYEHMMGSSGLMVLGVGSGRPPGLRGSPGLAGRLRYEDIPDIATQMAAGTALAQ